MAKQLSMWVGFKPTALDISFSRQISGDSTYTLQENGRPSILIHERQRHNAYVCAALLAENLLRYYFEHRKHLVLKDPREQQTLIMLAVVYAGLGLVMLNNAPSYWQQQYPRLYARFSRKRPQTMIQARYRAMVQLFASDYRLDLTDVSGYLCPWVEKTQPGLKTTREAGFVRRARTQSRRAYSTLVTSLLIILVGMALSGYVLEQRPENVPLALRQEHEEIDILRKSYELCNKAVAEKQAAYSQSDFFLERALDADRARCVSLRNLYNYRVDHYNQQLSR